MRLGVQAQSALLADRIDVLLNSFATPQSSFAESQHPLLQAGAFSLRMTYEPTPTDQPPADLDLLWAGRLPGGQECAFYVRGPGRRIDLPGLVRLRMDLQSRQAQIAVKPGCEASIAFGCVIPLLSTFLGLVGQHLIHAASLALIDGPAPAGMLLSGPSGVGKTTTALAMSRGQLRLLADDASFVGQVPSPTGLPSASARAPLGVWGLPRPCKVHQRTLELLPWLQKLPQQPAGGEEVLIDFARIAGPAVASVARPSVILFLDRRNDRGHHVTPVDKVTALTRLTRENVRALDSRADGPAGRAFGVLAELVQQCQTHLLSVGPNLESLAGEMTGLLRG